jgi:hypothetical protein
MNVPTYIYSAAAQIWDAAEDGPPDLRTAVKDAWGKRFRRVNHFIELSLVGVKACLSPVSEAPLTHCEIYLATEQGNVADVAHITEGLYKQREAPMPLEFLNVPNNMAGFYLAHGLGLRSANLTLAHRHFPFETALDLALFNLTVSHQTDACALVGGVDECAYPLAEHRQRLGLANDAPLAESSSWLFLGKSPKNALARCDWVQFFSEHSALLSFLQQLDLPASTLLAGGFGMDTESLNSATKSLNINKRYECNTAYHDSYCATLIAGFANDQQGQCLLYINRDTSERYVAVCISRLECE